MFHSFSFRHPHFFTAKFSHEYKRLTIGLSYRNGIVQSTLKSLLHNNDTIETCLSLKSKFASRIEPMLMLVSFQIIVLRCLNNIKLLCCCIWIFSLEQIASEKIVMPYSTVICWNYVCRYNVLRNISTKMEYWFHRVVIIIEFKKIKCSTCLLKTL